MRQRLLAVGFSIAMAVAVLSPLWRDPPRDSFPLSNYPMFSGHIGTVSDVHTVVGRTPEGERRRLSPEVISASDEVIMAAADVGRAVAAGGSAPHALCLDVAARVAANLRFDDVVDVEVVTERYDALAFFGGDREPMQITVHAGCGVR